MQSDATVVLIDDEPELLRHVSSGLQQRDPGLTLLTASSAKEALQLLETAEPEVAVVDLSLDPLRGPESGLQLIEELRREDPCIRLIALTGHARELLGPKAVERGAASFLQKPPDIAHLFALVQDGISYARLKRSYLQQRCTPTGAGSSLGLHSRNKKMAATLERLAFAAFTEQPVLLLGETGTGKSLFAQALHAAGKRSEKALVRFQASFCGRDLIHSELFGHRKGAFTGAGDSRRGLLHEAHRGSLFIDEVDQLPADVQVMLLDVLQSGQFRSLGSPAVERSDFRLITASNQSRDALIRPEGLREDFFHRIAHCTITIPPLRERPEDIPDLSANFLQQLVDRERLALYSISSEANALLSSLPWPGNVRQLQAVVEGACYSAAYCGRRSVEISDIDHDQPKPAHGSGSFREQVRAFEFRLASAAMQRCDNNQSRAAASLQLDRSSLRRVLERGRSPQ